MKTLIINGVEKQYPNQIPKTLTELLKQLNIDETTVVAEVNGKIIDRKNFTKTALCSGQNIELIRFVGGG